MERDKKRGKIKRGVARERKGRERGEEKESGGGGGKEKK